MDVSDQDQSCTGMENVAVHLKSLEKTVRYVNSFETQVLIKFAELKELLSAVGADASTSIHELRETHAVEIRELREERDKEKAKKVKERMERDRETAAYNQKLVELRESEAQLRQQITEMESSRQEAEMSMEDRIRELNSCKEDYEQQMLELNNRHEAEKHKLLNDIEQIRSAQESQSSSLAAERDNLLSELNRVRGLGDELAARHEAEKSKLLGDIQSLKAGRDERLSAHEQELEKLQAEHEAISEHNRRLEAELVQHQQRVSTAQYNSLKEENATLRAELAQFEDAAKQALLGSAQQLNNQAASMFQDAANRRLDIQFDGHNIREPSARDNNDDDDGGDGVCGSRDNSDVEVASHESRPPETGFNFRRPSSQLQETQPDSDQELAQGEPLRPVPSQRQVVNQQTQTQGQEARNTQRAPQSIHPSISDLQEETRRNIQRLQQQRRPQSAFDRLSARRPSPTGDAKTFPKNVDNEYSKANLCKYTHVHVCHCVSTSTAVDNRTPFICPMCDPVQNSNHRHASVSRDHSRHREKSSVLTSSNAAKVQSNVRNQRQQSPSTRRGRVVVETENIIPIVIERHK